MNLDAVNPELESKINDLVCETYNKPFLEQEKLLKEAFELIPKPVPNGRIQRQWLRLLCLSCIIKIKNMNRLRNG